MAAVLTQGIAHTLSSMVASAPASKMGASAPPPAASAGPVLARPAFFGSPQRLAQSAAQQHKAQPVGRVSATCQPGWGGQRFARQADVRQQWARAQRRRAAQAAAGGSSWGAADCMPGVGFMGPWGMPMGRVQPGTVSGLNQVLEEVFRQLAGRAFVQGGRGCGVEESKDGWVLRFDLPGFGAEDVKVQVEDGHVLSIVAKQADEDADFASAQFRSRGAGGLKACFPLPDVVRVEGIAAELKKGILVVSLPKRAVEEKKPTVINVLVREAAANASAA